MNWSARRINKIAALNGAQYYLEIGVHKGKTFTDVAIEYKDGVDPKFQFDTESMASDKIRFFSEKSDEFWTAARNVRYDVIMIDGLHTFEQTFRDLLCSLRYAHARTVWLIDDTMPTDVFSAIPNQAISYRERAKMRIPGKPWHGDVYKIVLAMHDFLPTLDYATMVGSGNSQTLVWNGSRNKFKPAINNLEAISRLSFFDIEAHRELFRISDEDAAFSELSKVFTS